MDQVTAQPSPILSTTSILSLDAVQKSFGGIRALDRASLHLHAGQVMALVGENGAGKSTAVKILTGIERPDAGRVLVAGAPVALHGAQDAWRHGIAAVYQETAMFDELTVAENIFMGHLVAGRGGWLDWAAMRRRASAILATLESELDAGAPLGSLSVAQKHLVEIARALSHDARVVIMDEPTAALSTREIEELYRIIRRLRAAGVAILFISHKLDEILAVADRYTVFRDGARVGEGAVADIDEDGLVRLMVGRPVTQIFPKTDVAIGGPVMEVRDLASDTEFDGISFSLRRGEVLGFYGLVGAGRTELMEALFGLKRVVRGAVTMDGRPAGTSPRRAIERGIVLVPEDRQRHGAIVALSIRQNLALPSARRLARWLLADRAAETALARQIADRLAIKHADLEQRVGELSGGNQQKVVIGKWLATRPTIIILDEPTKGIDVGSKAAVHEFIGELVGQGLSVILVSSELPELMGIADRIIVMHKGRMVRVLARAEFDAGVIVGAAAGLGPSSLEGADAGRPPAA
ncbi:MAG TPA: sugar ABC transporter ATP-binding protein [Kofleriaceae bacterium]|nr:sugar ABC transporter ATP-binding protein [Kofleriaceae bacterium]